MGAAFDRVEAALRGRIRRHGNQYAAQCPVPSHGDGDRPENWSLRIAENETRALLYCHGGCRTEDVAAALGLVMDDLYNDPRGNDLARYVYTDMLGNARRTVHRRDGKQFRQSFVDDDAKHDAPPLYRLPRIVEAVANDQPIYLVEGEEDVHTLETLDLVATTGPQGASNFHKVDVSPLRGAAVLAIRDKDTAGAKWTAMVRERLAPIVASLTILQAAAGKDVSDHLTAGHTLDELELVEAVEILAENEAEPAGDDVQEELPSYREFLESQLIDTDGLDSIVDPEPLIGQDLLFLDSLAWIVGKPGAAKSFVALDMAGCIATGQPWQGYRVSTGSVLYLVAEGVRGTKKRVRAWEHAMGQKMHGVQFLPVAVQAALRGHWDALVDLAGDMRPQLIVLDTQARITVGIEENSNTEMGQFVEAAERLRQASGACVILVHHIGRTGDTGRGATTLDGALSTVIKVTRDENAVTLECQKNKDGEEWDKIQLRTVPVLDSLVVVAADDLTPGSSAHGSALPGWLTTWWETHRDEAVSLALLIRTNVVAESSFFDKRHALIERGVMGKVGEGRNTRYRLLGDPKWL